MLLVARRSGIRGGVTVTCAVCHAGTSSSQQAPGPYRDMQNRPSTAMMVPKLLLAETSSESAVHMVSVGDLPSMISQESSLSAGPLAAVDSSLTVESSLPDGMCMSSDLSGVTAGPSLQSLIYGAVARFADE